MDRDVNETPSSASLATPVSFRQISSGFPFR